MSLVSEASRKGLSTTPIQWNYEGLPFSFFIHSYPWWTTVLATAWNNDIKGIRLIGWLNFQVICAAQSSFFFLVVLDLVGIHTISLISSYFVLYCSFDYLKLLLAHLCIIRYEYPYIYNKRYKFSGIVM